MTSLGFDSMTSAEYRQWFAEHAPTLRHRSPFHHPSWIGAVAQGTRTQPFFLTISAGGELIGVLPGFFANLGPLKAFGSPLRGQMTSYLGPVGPGLPTHADGLVQVTADAIDFLRSRFRLAYARTVLRDTPAAGTPSLGVGWAQQRPGSYRLDITGGPERVWQGLTSDCRRNIRRTIERGVTIADLDDPDSFYDMLDQTLRRHGSTSSHKPRFFRALFDESRPAGILRSLCAQHEGSVLSAGLFLLDDTEIHHLSGASNPVSGSSPTSYLLHWRAIEDAAGLKVYNSDASRIRSIDRFKESFGARLDRRHTLIWSPRPVYRAQKGAIVAYRRYRNLRATLSGPRS
jgi:hypothetical protein